MKLQGLYLIADTTQLADKNTNDYIAALIKAGVAMIQFRDKKNYADERITIDERRRLCQTIQRQCRIHNIPFIVNDDVALATETDADGVHLGRDDMSVREARQYLGPNKYIGVSCYASKQRALQAQTDGADYVTFGAISSSITKPQAQCLGSSVEQSLQILAKLTVDINVPICAIGGITADKTKQILGCGVQIIAVASGILTATNPRHTVEQYRAAWLK